MIDKSEPDTLNVILSKSVAVTVPMAVWFSGAVNTPAEVNTGAVVSTTLTVLVAVAELLSLSVAVYVIVYVPTVLVSTVPEEVTGVEPWKRSSAVAPASV